MHAVDTNVLLRWILNDHPVESPAASAVLADPVFIAATVLLETGWVLHKRIGLDRATTASALKATAALENAVIGRPELIDWAITRFERGADWADVLHLVESAGLPAAFLTFDGKLGRQAGSGSPIPVQTLPI